MDTSVLRRPGVKVRYSSFTSFLNDALCASRPTPDRWGMLFITVYECLIVQTLHCWYDV